MSKEKQISEIAKILTEYADCGECEKCNFLTVCGEKRLATKLYEAGYRKQSEGEWIDRYNGKYANPIYECSQCGEVPLKKTHINELNTMELIDALSSFCPNCGSKMKGGAE